MDSRPLRSPFTRLPPPVPRTTFQNKSHDLWNLAWLLAEARGLRVALTGASGFEGREIAHQLRADGHAVLMLSRPGGAARVGAMLPDADGRGRALAVREAELTDEAALASALRDFDTDVLVHTAAVFQRGLADPDAQMVAPTIAMAEAAARACAAAGARLVHTSSMAAVRGAAQAPGPSGVYTSACRNRVSRRAGPGMEPYQFAKATADARCAELCARLGVPLLTLCPSAVFGPPRGVEQRAALSCALVAGWLRGAAPVESRLAIDVRDLARAHVAAARAVGAEAMGGGAWAQRLIVSAEARAPAPELAAVLRAVVRERVGAERFAGRAEIRADASFGGCGGIAVGAREVADDAAAALGLAPYRSAHDSLADMARALFELGVGLLDWSSRALREDGIAALRPVLESLGGRLRTLDLSANELADAGLVALVAALGASQADAGTATRLTSLVLSRNGIGDAGGCALAVWLSDNRSLHRLDLSDNRLANRAAVALATSLRAHRSLESLSLVHNSVRRRGLQALAELVGARPGKPLRIDARLNLVNEAEAERLLELADALQLARSADAAADGGDGGGAGAGGADAPQRRRDPDETRVMAELRASDRISLGGRASHGAALLARAPVPSARPAQPQPQQPQRAAEPAPPATPWRPPDMGSRAWATPPPTGAVRRVTCDASAQTAAAAAARDDGGGGARERAAAFARDGAAAVARETLEAATRQLAEQQALELRRLETALAHERARADAAARAVATLEASVGQLADAEAAGALRRRAREDERARALASARAEADGWRARAERAEADAAAYAREAVAKGADSAAAGRQVVLLSASVLVGALRAARAADAADALWRWRMASAALGLRAVADAAVETAAEIAADAAARVRAARGAGRHGADVAAADAAAAVAAAEREAHGLRAEIERAREAERAQAVDVERGARAASALAAARAEQIALRGELARLGAELEKATRARAVGQAALRTAQQQLQRARRGAPASAPSSPSRRPPTPRDGAGSAPATPASPASPPSARGRRRSASPSRRQSAGRSRSPPRSPATSALPPSPSRPRAVSTAGVVGGVADGPAAQAVRAERRAAAAQLQALVATKRAEAAEAEARGANAREKEARRVAAVERAGAASARAEADARAAELADAARAVEAARGEAASAGRAAERERRRAAALRAKLADARARRLAAVLGSRPAACALLLLARRLGAWRAATCALRGAALGAVGANARVPLVAGATRPARPAAVAAAAGARGGGARAGVPGGALRLAAMPLPAPAAPRAYVASTSPPPPAPAPLSTAADQARAVGGPADLLALAASARAARVREPASEVAGRRLAIQAELKRLDHELADGARASAAVKVIRPASAPGGVAVASRAALLSVGGA